jgi:hypothetical protein
MGRYRASATLPTDSQSSMFTGGLKLTTNTSLLCVKISVIIYDERVRFSTLTVVILRLMHANCCTHLTTANYFTFRNSSYKITFPVEKRVIRY